MKNSYTKKDFINHMKLFTKILYYLWIIIPLKKLPEKQTGHLIIEKPFFQVAVGNEISSYWRWNYFNPLTYIVWLLLIIMMIIIHIIMGLFEMIVSMKFFKVTINND